MQMNFLNWSVSSLIKLSGKLWFRNLQSSGDAKGYQESNSVVVPIVHVLASFCGRFSCWDIVILCWDTLIWWTLPLIIFDIQLLTTLGTVLSVKKNFIFVLVVRLSTSSVYFFCSITTDWRKGVCITTPGSYDYRRFWCHIIVLIWYAPW